MIRPTKILKTWMPGNLFARTLLILLLPVIMLQLTLAYVFYDRHWGSVVRSLSSAAAADVHVLLQEYTQALEEESPEEALKHSQKFGKTLDIRVALTAPKTVQKNKNGADDFPDFYRSLNSRIEEPFTISQTRSGQSIRVHVVVGEQTLEFTLPAKRLASPTTYIFIFWMLGSATVLMLVAGLFLRNQIRPIVQLARAAEQFGLGQDVLNFSPRGASEIRLAGQSFLKMAERIRRALVSRTEMLAGISHDLRTPLTRMQLEIEMGKIDPTTRQQLVTDIEEMRRMIDEYLDFARGDAGEPMEAVDTLALLQQLAAQYARQGEAVTFATTERSITLMLRPQAIRRALTNLIENALRYGAQADIAIEESPDHIRIHIRDAGPGIADADVDTVFKPFTRLEPSRNVNTGGVGLGLSIARDIAQSHGGDITLTNRRSNSGEVIGLEATLRLPRAAHACN